jgi:hypothetical protein
LLAFTMYRFQDYATRQPSHRGSLAQKAARDPITGPWLTKYGRSDIPFPHTPSKVAMIRTV